jgi:hypothetical protein
MDQEQRRPSIKQYRRTSLAEEDVAQIKTHLQQGKSSAILAMYFNVDRRTISGIRDKQIYRQVAPAAKARPLSEILGLQREYEPFATAMRQARDF